MKPEVLLIFQPRFEESAEMLQGVVQYLRSQRPWRVSLYEVARTEIDPCCWLRSRRWDGVISQQTTPELVQACGRLGVPLIDLSDTPPAGSTARIRPDHQAIGEMGADFFLQRRFSRFAFFGYANHPWSAERREGFLGALGRAGCRGDVFDVEAPAELTPTWEANQLALLAAWLRCLPAGIAVMTCDDQRARQVVQAAQMAGRRVPDEVAVLGANNHVMRCELSELPTSSVALNSREAGRRAAEHLAGLIAGENPGELDLRIAPLGVVLRKSTDVPEIGDEKVALALRYLREHACEGLTVTQVLRQVPMTRSVLEHKLRRYIGRSPQAEIRHVQVAKIRQLLTETNLGLKEIADRTGFAHVEYLCVVFKRIAGETPGQYRHRNIRLDLRPTARGGELCGIQPLRSKRLARSGSDQPPQRAAAEPGLALGG